MSLFQKTAALVFLARLRPGVHDALIPHSSKMSVGTRNVMASMIVKAITKEITDAVIDKQLKLAAKSLFKAGAESMDYEDDNWCLTPIHPRIPPHPVGPQPEPWFTDGIRLGIPVPWAWADEAMLNPQPLPPHEHAYYGALLTLLADAVSVKDIAESLREIGHALMKQDFSADEKYANDPPYTTFEKSVM
ncbi:hypothetical protein [Chryseolinea soli]|uniref:Uncharacterized protein n=1 Tax=Chryseolinea soli TaxID=2321403 RepID=A0A385STV8_9BACT|nr:hypothetical protein [Chryseolinea soli]AYB34354.1 hypothetical protein D4L85_28925 [Chryseolinea soli]